MDLTQRTKDAQKITFQGLVINFVLTILKYFGGILGNSAVMAADAIHSLSDLISDVILLVGIKFASKPADEKHNYGHGKIETFMTFTISILLLSIGIKFVIFNGSEIYNFMKGKVLPIPSWIALFASIISIISKEILFHYTKRKGNELNSNVLIANAWHHRSDALSSVAALLGIGLVMILGNKWAVLDPVAGMIVSFMVLHAGYSIFKESLDELLEAAVPKEDQLEITKIASSVKGCENPHQLTTRKVGYNISIEMHIDVNPDLNIIEGHEIATNVEIALREKYGEGTLISIHIEPKRG